MASSACHRKSRASRGQSKAPSSWVNSKGFVAIIIVSLLARLAARLLSFLAPFVLLLGLLGLTVLRGRVAHALAFLFVEDRPHRLLARGKAGGDVEQLVRVDRRVVPELAPEVSSRGALEEGLHDFGLSDARELRAALGKAPYEVPERLTKLLGARTQVPGVSRAHIRALEVPHEGADQIIPVVDLAGRQVLEPRPR
jgi:hypothetical protein